MFDIPENMRDIVKRYRSERDVAVGTVEVEVLADLSTVEEFTTEVWNNLNDQWSNTHYGSALPVARDELRDYFFTAIKMRVLYARNERCEVRLDDNWALPSSMAVLIAQIGRVDIEAPVARLLPRWNSEADSFVLTYEAWLSMTQRMRSIERDPDARFIFANALSKDRTGNPELMTLIPIRDDLGRYTEIRGSREVDAFAASAYIILGMMPEGLSDTVLASHPLLSMPYYVPGQVSIFIRQQLAVMRSVKST